MSFQHPAAAFTRAGHAPQPQTRSAATPSMESRPAPVVMRERAERIRRYVSSGID